MKFLDKIPTFFLILLLPALLIGQEFDESFIASLPKDVRADFEAVQALQDKDQQVAITNPETRIQNLENALADAKRILSNIENSLDEEVNPSERFGYKFFDTFQSTFLPINLPNVEPNYILDVGDEITLQLVGQVNETEEYFIKRNGSISVEEVGEIFLAGLQLSEGIQLVKERISQTFIGTEAFMSVSSLRDISVMAVGNIRNPGMYTLSGSSTALSLINAAGGIDDSGSYRNIEHKRGGKIINIIDLYDIFVSGNLTKLLQLRSGDVLIVKQAETSIRVSGGIANPAVYEIKDDENLGDLLDYSGYKKNNSSKDIFIKRSSNNVYEQLKVSFADSKNFKLQDGDSVEIPYVIPKFSPAREVTITGAVNIPGTYFVDDQTSVSDLITLAGSYKDVAYPLGGILQRERVKNAELAFKEKSYNELVRFLLANSGSQISVGLNSNSLVTFLSILKEYEPSGRLITEFELSELKKNPLKDRKLENGDSIHIPEFTNEVYVFGEILNPMGHGYDPKISIKKYIEMSGGFSRAADENKVIIVQPNGIADTIEFGFLNSVNKNHDILPGSLIYVPQYVGKVEGINFASAVAPIISSFALSIASLNSINN